MKPSFNFIRFIPFLFWIILVYILLTLPGKDFGSVEVDIPNLDKLVHMGLFGGVVFWFGFAWINIDRTKTRRGTVIITIVACIYGIAMEYVQKYFTTRDFSYGDMVADSLGAIIAYFVIRAITKKYQLQRAKNSY
ncbi:hypothetical protein A9P82_04970 [Arachidicoccus ginsenosidimutans]|uniref:VanZ family protein n=1 Tax=Arachidicoccus sp. BS20 TaxID=1850526 RepID=UPI0007F0E8D2|nr:VanZ family protein [Arachidicoccus sp. BS20]ANI88694.1 hypothetical protein A9P82_04970 [Arachidicoccus sp. BS20]